MQELPQTDLCVRSVHCMDLIIKPHVRYCHTILDECSSLVRTDYRNGFESLYSFDILYQTIVLRHSFRCPRQHNLLVIVTTACNV